MKNKKHYFWAGILGLIACVLLFYFKTPPQEPIEKPVIVEEKKDEKYYVELWRKLHDGVSEYRLEDGTRVDVVTSEYAVELDFASKWYQAVGQSLHYALHTHKDPGIVLILKKNKDRKYLDRLVSVIHGYDLPITVWQVIDDTETLVYTPAKKRKLN